MQEEWCHAGKRPTVISNLYISYKYIRQLAQKGLVKSKAILLLFVCRFFYWKGGV